MTPKADPPDSSPGVLGRVPPSSPRSFSLLLTPPQLFPSSSIFLARAFTLASNTSKSSLLAPRVISFSPEMDGPQRLSPNTQKQGRRRRSSSIIYQEPAESMEHISDQAALPNLNANWVNAKGESSLHGPVLCPPKGSRPNRYGHGGRESLTGRRTNYQFRRTGLIRNLVA